MVGKPSQRSSRSICTSIIPALFVLTLGLSAQTVFAQDPIVTTEVRPTMQAARMPQGADIGLDGRLDESVWALATPITEFRQQEPVEGGVPSEPTEIRIL